MINWKSNNFHLANNNYLAAGWPKTVFWLENNDGVFVGVLLTAKGLAAGEKLLTGCDGLHACCPNRDMLPNADPGELNPREVWPKDDGWLAAAATDPNNPLDAAVVAGEPNIDDVELVTDGAPKIDEAVVEVVPNTELVDEATVGLPKIDELVAAGEPNTVVVWAEVPKPPVEFVFEADPKIEDTVVAEGVPNIDEAVVFKGFPKIDDEEVETGAPKIEAADVVLEGDPNNDDTVVALVGVPNIDVVVVFVGVPKIEEVLVVLTVVAKTVGALVAFVEVLKIEGALDVFVGVLKIEGALDVIVGVLNIEGAVDLVVLNSEVWSFVLLEFPKMLAVLVVLVGVLKTEELVDEISKIGTLLVVIGVVGTFSLSGVTGSDIIGDGLSETWGIVSVTLLLFITRDVMLELEVLRLPKVEDTDGDTTDPEVVAARVFGGSEKLNDADTAVDVEVKSGLVSDTAGFKTLSLGAVKLNVENDTLLGFELKLKEARGASLTVSCLFIVLSSVVNPEVSKGEDKVFGVSKLKLANGVFVGVSILFLIDSAKLKDMDVLLFVTVDSVLAIDIVVKLKAVLSFDLVVSIIVFETGGTGTALREVLKFKGAAVDDLILKSTGSLVEALDENILLPNNGVDAALKTTGSLGQLCWANLLAISLNAAGLGVEVFSIGFQTGFIVVVVGTVLDPDENATVIGDTATFVCWADEINNGFLNCVESGLGVTDLVSAIFCSLPL